MLQKDLRKSNIFQITEGFVRLFEGLADRLHPETNFGSFVSILLYLILILAVTNRTGEYLVLSIPLLLLIYVSKNSIIDVSQLHVVNDQEIYRVLEGDPVKIKCLIENLGPEIKEMKITKHLPAGLNKLKGVSSLITPLPSQDCCMLEYELSGGCGSYKLGEIEIHIPGFLGLTFKRKTITCDTKVLILPRVASKKGLVLRPHRVRPQTGNNPSRQGGDGIELFGVREYRPGDPLRYINGRASARHPRSLFIQEFERERVTTVYLLVDTQGRTQPKLGENDILHHCLEATSILSESLINSGNRVGLYIFGKFHNWVFPGSGKLQKEKILRALALETGNVSTWNTKLADLPTRFLTPRSLIILLSPIMGTELSMLNSLKGRRYQVLVINPDEIDFQEKKHTTNKAIQLSLRTAHIERKMAIRCLGESSIPVLNWQVDSPFELIASRFLGTYWK